MDNINASAELRARVALEKYGFRNNHNLGQNFLLSDSLVNDLLDAAELNNEDNILEIGPGAGVMTRLMAGRVRRVLAVEVDRGLEPVLSEVLDGMKNVDLVFQDILKADIGRLTETAFGSKRYRVLANLPYYITADVMLRLAMSECPPDSITVMVQKEAAERIMSSPGSKQWCALAAQLQYYGEARILREVPAEAFDPPPHVTSYFMRLDRYMEPPVVPMDEKLFHKLIRSAFAMRRKTLCNNLKAAFGMEQETARGLLAEAGLDERVRGEALSLPELAQLADVMHRHGL